jgi:2,4-dienoyl-CoA reductase-like NADH-dependent reductase (Old Yellow Enzyme family)
VTRNTLLCYLHQYFAKVLKENARKETVIIGSNYSLFGKGFNKLQAVTRQESSLLNFGAQNIQKGYVDMIGLGRQSLADPLLPLKVREGREAEINYCTADDHCLELLIRQKQVGCCTYNKRYTQILLDTRKELGALKDMHT